MFNYRFGVRSVPPCGDCDEDGQCLMNCGPVGEPMPRPKVNNELRNIEDKIAETKEGLLACYETIEVGRRKLARLEAKRDQIKQGESSDL